MQLSLITVVITLFMSARVGSVLFGHFGFIHLFSLLAAAVFALMPGRLQHG